MKIQQLSKHCLVQIHSARHSFTVGSSGSFNGYDGFRNRIRKITAFLFFCCYGLDIRLGFDWRNSYKSNNVPKYIGWLIIIASICIAVPTHFASGFSNILHIAFSLLFGISWILLGNAIRREPQPA